MLLQIPVTQRKSIRNFLLNYLKATRKAVISVKDFIQNVHKGALLGKFRLKETLSLQSNILNLKEIDEIVNIAKKGYNSSLSNTITVNSRIRKKTFSNPQLSETKPMKIIDNSNGMQNKTDNFKKIKTDKDIFSNEMKKRLNYRRFSNKNKTSTGSKKSIFFSSCTEFEFSTFNGNSPSQKQEDKRYSMQCYTPTYNGIKIDSVKKFKFDNKGKLNHTANPKAAKIPFQIQNLKGKSSNKKHIIKNPAKIHTLEKEMKGNYQKYFLAINGKSFIFKDLRRTSAIS